MSSEAKPYREGDDPETPVQPAPVVDNKATTEPEPNTREWFERQAKGPRPPQPKGDQTKMPGSEEEVYTAVLLVQTHEGTVMPVTNLPNVKMHHAATPHEVFRMCADVQNQISSVRTIGEILRGTHQITRTELRGLFHELTGTKPPAQSGP